MTPVPTSAPAAPSGERRQRARLVATIARTLDRTYNHATLGNHTDPLEEAVYILLSRQTQEVSYQRTHTALRSRWLQWEELRAATAEDIATVLRPSGLSWQRANQLKELLDAVAAGCASQGIPDLTLDWVKGLDDTAAEAYLAGLPGLSVKSARCVMHYALDRRVFAVDTHIRRILDRLGLVPDLPGKVKHARYDEVIAPRFRQHLHVNLIHHGRLHCKARAPQCAGCPLAGHCPTVAGAVAGSQPRRSVREA